jgi:hybrid cluster-associated redox disulfide protein
MATFNKDMTVAEAQALHPRAREVFAGYHLGGCAHCAISEFETIQQVCEGYGVPVDAILASLESLVAEDSSGGSDNTTKPA